MKLEFRLKSGKLIGTINPVYAIVTLSALSGAIVAFLSEFESLKTYRNELIILLKGEEISDIKSWLIVTFSFIGLLLTGILSIYASIDILTGFLRLRREFVRHYFNKLYEDRILLKGLLNRKIAKEIQTYDKSLYDLHARSNEAKKDAKDLHKAARSKLIDNEEIRRFNPPEINDLNNKGLNHFYDIPDLHNLKEKIIRSSSEIEKVKDEIIGKEKINRPSSEVKKNKEKTIENENSEKPIKPMVKFFAAAVQPSIQLLISDLHTKHKLSGYLDIENQFNTGPEAVRRARLAHITSTEERILLVAPLAAFCMAPDDEPLELQEQFTPLFNVITENQDILVVESSSRTPLKKGRFYYYDNSTAEEILAKRGQNIKQLLDIIPIKEYTTYRDLLQGKDTQSGKLEIGDAIATWPPLTDYYNGESVADGFFCKNAFEFDTEIQSQIFLFVDNRCLEEHLKSLPPPSKLCWSLIHEILLQMKNSRYNKVDKQRQKQFVRDNLREFGNLIRG